MNVFILPYCRNEKLFGLTTLVFDTLRIGFPNARVRALAFLQHDGQYAAVEKLCRAHDVEMSRLPEASHPARIARELTECENEPFYLADTDLIFWENFERFQFSGPLAGRFIPAFYDDFTRCPTMARLHTSLLHVAPVKVRSALADYYARFPDTKYNPHADPFQPLQLPGQFFDQCGVLYRMIGGEHFSETQLDCYDHLHCGSISDLVGPHLTHAPDLADRHQYFLAHRSEARGIWRAQEAYYRSRALAPHSAANAAPSRPDPMKN